MVGRSVLSLRGAFRADLALRHCPGSGRRQGRAPARSSLSVVVDVPPCQQAKQNDDDDSCYFLTHAFLPALMGRTPRCMSRSLSTSVLSWTVMIVYQCILGTEPGVEHPHPVKFISHTLSIGRCGAIANRRRISIMGKTAGITALLPSGHFISPGMTLASKSDCCHQGYSCGSGKSEPPVR